MIDLEDEFESSRERNEGRLSKSGLKEFLSDPGVSHGSEEVSGKSMGRRHSSDDVHEIKRKEWNHFLSTSHLLGDEESSKMPTLSPKTDELLREVPSEHDSSALAEDMATRQLASTDIQRRSLPTVARAAFDNETLPAESHFIVSTSSPSPREASGDLPVRPLTIGDSMTMGNPVSYRPISPFNADLYPSRTASSTPAIPALSSASQHSGNILEADADDREGDMTSRERLQPLGRDGLEVKQGPPWGVTLPLFEPDSRKSSFSSSDSSSGNDCATLIRHLPPSAELQKTDAESSSPVVSIPLSEGRLSRRSSLRSVESKEPMATQVLNGSGTLKSQIGRFRVLNPTNPDVESPVSKILGPTFKATQKMLEELKRRPLGAYRDEMEQQEAQKDDAFKTLGSFGPSGEKGAEGKDIPITLSYLPTTSSHISATQSVLEVDKFTKSSQADLGDHTTRSSELVGQEVISESDPVDNSRQIRSADLTAKTEQHFAVENGSKLSLSFSASSSREKLESLVQNGSEQSPNREADADKTCGLKDSMLGYRVTISNSADLTSKNEPYIPVKNNSEVNRSFSSSSRNGELGKLVENGLERSPHSKTEVLKASEFTDSSLGDRRPVSSYEELTPKNERYLPVKKIPRSGELRKLVETGVERSTYSETETLKTSEFTDSTMGGRIPISNYVDLTPKNELHFPAKNNSEVNLVFPTSSRRGELESLVESGPEGSRYNNTETNRTSGLADKTQGISVAVSSFADLAPQTEPYLPGKNILVGKRSFSSSFKSGDSESSVKNSRECDTHSQTETHKTSNLTDSTPRNRVTVSGNVDSVKSTKVTNDASESGSKQVERQDIVDTGQESLSWENVLEVHSGSGNMSEFDRVASQSISWSNSVANRFREELKGVDLLDLESDNEGILVNDITWASPLLDSGASESTANDDTFSPKGLHPLTEHSGPVGIYDVRESSGPGSTNRKRVALGLPPRAATCPVIVSGVYVSEGMTASSGTEVDDKVVESMPEGHSTPKSDDQAMIMISEEDERMAVRSNSAGDSTFKGVNIPNSTGSFRQTQPSAVVEHTWSISTPVMSQLDTKSSSSAGLKAKQRPKNRLKSEQESARSFERVQRHREQGKKPSKTVKQLGNSNSSDNISSDSSHHGRRGAGLGKKSAADIILENFRREEQEQKKRQRKLEELKQSQTTTDLNALWDRFQEFLRKNSKNSQKRKSRQHSPNRKFKQLLHAQSSQRTTPSELSVASSSDIPFTENKQRDQMVDLSTDSGEEFEKFLRRVREFQSSDSASITSRTSSSDRRSRQSELRSSSSNRANTRSSYQVCSSEQVTSTTEKDSEPEVPLSLPMWLGTNIKHSKKKANRTLASNSAVCTCGRSTKKTAAKAVPVRDVGVNCPTPPMFSHETNIVNNGVPIDVRLEESQSTDTPPSLVKLSLQDAFVYSKQDFIRRSRDRIRIIKEKREEARSGVAVVVPTGRRIQKKDRVNERTREDEGRTGAAKSLKLYGK